MNKRKVGHIKLVFYDPAVVVIPGVNNGSPGELRPYIIKKTGSGGWGMLPPVYPYKPLGFIGWIGFYLKLGRYRLGSPIGGNTGTLAIFIVFKAVKRTLYPVIGQYLPLSQGSAPVGTAVYLADYPPIFGPPEHQPFSKPDTAHWFLFNFPGFQYHIPLIPKHSSPFLFDFPVFQYILEN
jgi:hypothetical protein